jgi:hypothetical protein
MMDISSSKTDHLRLILQANVYDLLSNDVASHLNREGPFCTKRKWASWHYTTDYHDLIYRNASCPSELAYYIQDPSLPHDIVE